MLELAILCAWGFTWRAGDDKDLNIWRIHYLMFKIRSIEIEGEKRKGMRRERKGERMKEKVTKRNGGKKWERERGGESERARERDREREEKNR